MSGSVFFVYIFWHFAAAAASYEWVSQSFFLVLLQRHSFNILTLIDHLAQVLWILW